MSSRPAILFLAACLIGPIHAHAQTAAEPAGRWEGKIEIPSQPMGLTVDLARNAEGKWIGSMSIPSSTTIDVPLDDVAVAGADVRFTARLPRKTSFTATLSPEGRALAGTVENLDGRVPFGLTRTGDASVKVPPPSSPLTKAFEGAWEGTVDVAGKTMRISLTLSAAPDGTAVAALVSVDRGNQDVPVTTVSIADKELRLEARVVSGGYRGTLGETGEIAGEWTQGGAKLPLLFKRAASK